MNEIQVYEFEDHGGETIDEHGRAHWPDQLTVCMDSRAVWDIIHAAMAHLRYDADKPFYVYLSGKLTKANETEAQP